MLPNFSKYPQKGYISLVLIVFALFISALIFPFKFPAKNYDGQSGGAQFCREFVSDAESEATKVDLPSHVDSDSDSPVTTVTYKLIKKNVPIKPQGYEAAHHVNRTFVDTKVTTSEGEKSYRALYPRKQGRSYDFNTEDGEIDFEFREYGIIFLMHLKDDGTPETVDVDIDGKKETLNIIDIYQDSSKPSLPHSDIVLKCIDSGVESVVNPEVIVPEQDTSDDKKQVQLEWFVIKQDKVVPKAWWTPECKPAIYLYPKQKQLVNVKVFPKGELTYADPPYDFEHGWAVWAQPNGKLNALSPQPSALSQNYNYLYYESKIYDNAINKPSKGWVVEFEKLESLYKDILPRLGLNEAETNDFIDYWKKALPQAPYYFVGVLDEDNVNEIEKLEITPKPDSINRVRIYFERLDSFKQVNSPVLPSSFSLPTSKFHVTEWGGMVKNDPNHLFTCSQ